MHELAITQSILNQALKEAQKCNAKSIKKIKLKIGQGTAILPECVEFYFNIIKENTIANNCRLEIETVPVKAQCPKCKKIVNVPEKSLDFELWKFSCQCHQGLEIISGQEMLIDYIDVEL
ncbi:MAG: hydrogenase maturation nickel metallochaperone HypA [candidate division WOR-3 bacterium]